MWLQMRKTNYALVCTVIVWAAAFTAPLHAESAPQPVTEQELSQKLRLYRSIHTLEVSFTQKKVIKDIDVRLTSEGRFKIIRPEKIIWEITKPSPVKVTFDKAEIRIESGAGASQHSQVLKLGDSLPDKAAKSLAGLVAWLDLDAKKLHAQYVIFHAGAQAFRFEPRQKEGSPFKDLLMTLGGDGHLKQLAIQETSGDTLDIEFGVPKIK